MRWGGAPGNSKVLPLGDVVMSDTRVIGSIFSVAGAFSNDRHSLNTDHALEGQVGLISNYAGQF